MRVLLDENLDVDFIDLLANYDVSHVRRLGWHGLVNGALITRAEAEGFEVLITGDKNIAFQHNWPSKRLSLVVLDVHPQTYENAATCLGDVIATLQTLGIGEVRFVHGPGATRRPK